MKKKAKKVTTSPRKVKDSPGHKKARGKILKELEKKIVEQKEEDSENEFEELEHEISEDPAEATEGLGIEKEEAAGQAAYPEIETAEKKDSDEEEED